MKALRQAAQPLTEVPAPGVVRIYSFLDPAVGFLADVQSGLSAKRKTLPARWRHDDAGMRAAEALSKAPEYYVCREERVLLQEHGSEIIEAAGAAPQLIEIGPSSGIQSGVLIDALLPPLYMPVQVDAAATRAVARRLAAAYPRLHIAGMLADPTRSLVLPEFPGANARRKALFLPAVSSCSYTPDELSDVLRQARGMAGPGGVLIAGIDLKKSRKVLEAAGNDAQGLAARLNVTLLERINRELGGDFQTQRFHHVAVHDEVLGCTGVYLESDFAQIVHVGGQRYDFAAGEVMLTGIASQYRPQEFEALAVEAGFILKKTWTDASRRVAIYLLSGS